MVQKSDSEEDFPTLRREKKVVESDQDARPLTSHPQVAGPNIAERVMVLPIVLFETDVPMLPKLSQSGENDKSILYNQGMR